MKIKKHIGREQYDFVVLMIINKFFVTFLEIPKWCRNINQRQRFYFRFSPTFVLYKCQKINFKRGCSYIYSEDCIEKKKATVNPRKKDDKCFQYATTVALNYGEIESHPERVSNIMPFIKKHNWDGAKCSSKIDD